ITSNALDSHLEAEAYASLSWEEIIEKGWTKFLTKRTGVLTDSEEGEEVEGEENPHAHVSYAMHMSELFQGWKNRPVVVELIPPEHMEGIGIIGLKRQPGKFRVHDYGVGLSPERVRGVYAKFFSSTKRGTNRQIGAF